MELRVFTEPQQGATYDDLLAVARAAEDLGYGAFFRSDHFLAMGRDGLPGPTDAWVTLAGLARETSTIRLGTLMTSATFRHPGLLAIAVAQVDQMSGGRVELGIGAGWFEQEHLAYGIPFPSTRERFDLLEESLAVVTGLWGTPAGERFDFTGSRVRLTDSPALPKPVQSPRPPVLVGGKGRRRTPELAARYADEFNIPFVDLAESREIFGRVREACAARGRDAGSLVLSHALVLCCGRDDAEVSRRAEAIGRRPRSCAPTGWPARRPRWSTGSDGTPRQGPSGSTCRSWTSRTWTTWRSCPTRWFPSSEAHVVCVTHVAIWGFRSAGVRPSLTWCSQGAWREWRVMSVGAVRGSGTGTGRGSASRMSASRARRELRDVRHPAHPELRVEQVLVCPTGVHVVTAVPGGGAPRPGDPVVSTARVAAQLVADLLPPRYRDRVRPVLRRPDEPPREGVVDLVEDVLVASATPLEHILRASVVVLSTSEVNEVAHRLGAVLEPFPVPAADRRRRWRPAAVLGGAGVAVVLWAVESGAAGITPPW